MARGDLTDAEWARLEPLLPPQKDPHRRGGQYRNHRQVINGILWVLRTGAPWRDLPERYGPWSTCQGRFRDWTKKGIWERALQRLQAQEDAAGKIDWSQSAIDGTYIKAHPHAAGARKRGRRRRSSPSKDRRWGAAAGA